MAEFFSQVNIHAARQFAFAWHEQPHALDRLIPPWERLELVSRTGGIQAGEVNLRKKVGPFWMGFKAIHSQFIKSEQFFDQMSGGPFSHWEHLHRFETEKSDQCVLHDEVSYRLRGGFLGKLLASRLVRNRLEQLFAYRRQITQHEIEDHFRFATVGTKSIAVTGAGGLLGKSICQLLANGGPRVIKLPRVNSTEP
ncbi:MAG: SRPBCC family protein, partial [Planctomycetota bacterium]|nr:SRPBCC family protein [Planctomycetota bacterium]